MLYLLTTGCQWRLLPTDFPPYTTVQRFFYGWRDDGTWRRINHHLLLAAREAMGREASPSAGVIDSQSVKTTEAGGPRGYDAGKKIKGSKRHILTDTNGLLVAATVHAADVQDRDGAVPLLASIRHRLPLAAPRLRRRRLCRRQARRPRWPRSARGRWRSSSAPMPPRLRAAAPTLGGRAHAGLAQPQPPPRQGLRGARSKPPPPGSCWPASSYFCAGWREDNQLIGY